MIILLTNDDGIESPGLDALYTVLGEKHETYIVAPKVERSGTSHGITLKEPVRLHKIGERRYTMDGTPADCVLYTLLGAVPVTPDVVISGINIGPNIGTDIIYSGTVAAARQAALSKIPGIALSLNTRKAPYYFTSLANFIRANLEVLVDLWHPDHFVNINAPNSPEPPDALNITHPSRRLYKDGLEKFQAPDGDTYLFLTGAVPHAEPEAGSDWEAVSKGNLSISPVYLHPINHTPETEYEVKMFKKAW